MSLKRFALLACSLSALVLASRSLHATDGSAALSAPETALPSPDGLADAELAAAAVNWTFYGCIELGQTCYDVFQDSGGTLWVCKACGTTGNPSPGKCRKLTAYEIANSRWCS